MRKVFHIFLSLLLIISTMGIVGFQHFCGDTLVSVELFHSESETGCCEDVPMDCCDDNLVEISPIQTNVTTPGTFSPDNPLESYFETFTDFSARKEISSSEYSVLIQDAVPDRHQHRRQLEFGCFLI